MQPDIFTHVQCVTLPHDLHMTSVDSTVPRNGNSCHPPLAHPCKGSLQLLNTAPSDHRSLTPGTKSRFRKEPRTANATCTRHCRPPDASSGLVMSALHSSGLTGTTATGRRGERPGESTGPCYRTGLVKENSQPGALP